MEVRRGDLIAIALQGDYGKPRPALVIQDDAFAALASVSVLRLTGELRDWPLFRITVEPDTTNGLQKTSQVMIDKPAAVPKTKIGRRIGHLDEASMQAVSMAFGRFHGLKGANEAC
jgi:mRNA interferase MazF